MSTSVIARQSATIVPEERRQEFLPTLFSHSLLIVAENAVYSLMERLSPLDYGGGFWDFYEHEGKPLFLAPQSKSRFRITGEITGFQGRCPQRPPASSPRCSPSPISPSSISPNISLKATAVSTPIPPTIRKLPRYSTRSIEKQIRPTLGWRA